MIGRPKARAARSSSRRPAELLAWYRVVRVTLQSSATSGVLGKLHQRKLGRQQRFKYPLDSLKESLVPRPSPSRFLYRIDNRFMSRISAINTSSSHSLSPKRILFASFLIVILASITNKFWPRVTLISRHFSPANIKSLSTASTSKMSNYSKELEVAQLAVQRAAILTKKVFHEKSKGTLSKDDKSPDRKSVV